MYNIELVRKKKYVQYLHILTSHHGINELHAGSIKRSMTKVFIP